MLSLHNLIINVYLQYFMNMDVDTCGYRFPLKYEVEDYRLKLQVEASSCWVITDYNPKVKISKEKKYYKIVSDLIRMEEWAN